VPRIQDICVDLVQTLLELDPLLSNRLNFTQCSLDLAGKLLPQLRLGLGRLSLVLLAQLYAQRQSMRLQLAKEPVALSLQHQHHKKVVKFH
jgi:hypothetical protein